MFERYCLDPEGRVTYGRVAGELGLTESDVRNYLRHARRELRSLPRTRIRDYTASSAEVADELRSILG